MAAGWMKTRNARKYISVCEKSFEKIVSSDQLTFVRLPSGHRRFHKNDLDEYMRRYEVNGRATKEVKSAADEILKGI
jgi:hypothetical protein